MERTHRPQSQSPQVVPLEVGGGLGTDPVPTRASQSETLMPWTAVLSLAPLEFLGTQQVPGLGAAHLCNHEVKPMACPKTNPKTDSFNWALSVHRPSEAQARLIP